MVAWARRLRAFVGQAAAREGAGCLSGCFSASKTCIMLVKAAIDVAVSCRPCHKWDDLDQMTWIKICALWLGVGDFGWSKSCVTEQVMRHTDGREMG